MICNKETGAKVVAENITIQLIEYAQLGSSTSRMRWSTGN